MPATGLPLQTSSRAPRLRRQRGRVPLESLVIYTLAFVLPFAAVITHMITGHTGSPDGRAANTIRNIGPCRVIDVDGSVTGLDI